MKVTLRGAEMRLLPEKCVYWPALSMLIISDVHLGKAGHFRKNGVPVPRSVHYEDMARIDQLIDRYHPGQILFLGDLFHSEFNNEWWDFMSWRGQYPSTRFTLVMGNHDILSPELFEQAAIEVVDAWTAGPFHFTHIREESGPLYNLSGHLHPGVRMVGAGKQSLTLPCFYFADDHGILPAFGTFTGTYRIRPTRSDQVFVVTDQVVVPVR